MKKKPEISKEWLQDIERVKTLFFRGKQNLFFPLSIEDKRRSHSHRSNFLKFPRIAQGTAFIKNDHAKAKPSKIKKSFVAAVTLVSSEKTLKNSLNLEWTLSFAKKPQSQHGLEPKRVTDWDLKEGKLAAKKLKEFKLQNNPDNQKRHDVIVIDETPENPNSMQYEKWEELIRNNEQRHFRIERVIKYLSD